MLTVTSSLRTSSLHPSEPDISTRESWAPEPFAPPFNFIKPLIYSNFMRNGGASSPILSPNRFLFFNC